MARSTDQLQVIRLAGRLIDGRAFRGAATVLFNAALQRQAAEVRDLTQWSPQGRIPLRRKAAPNLTAANDEHPATSEQPGGTVA